MRFGIYHICIDSLLKHICNKHGRIQRGGHGVRTPLKNRKNIGFLSNTGPNHLKHHKATKPVFNVGPSSACQRDAI